MVKMLNEKQTQDIKNKLVEQIESSFPKDKQQKIKSKILSMSSKELENFLKQNKMIKNSSSENPFRLIVNEKIPFIKIDENKNCLAILELNPISEGHTLIIPKKPIKEGKKIPAYLTNFAKKIEKKLKSKLKPKKILSIPTPMFDEIIINILPVYKDETLNSKRKTFSTQELEKIQKKILQKPIKKEKRKQIRKSEKLWLPKRIP